MKVAIGCDHIVTDIKNEVIEYLKKKGYEVEDCGTYDHTRCHYPVYGSKVGEKVASKECDYGVVICGTGIGITNSVNKVKGVRAALVQNSSMAKYAKEELNANVIGMGGRIIGMGRIEEIIDTFFTTEYIPTEEKEELIQKINNLSCNNNYQFEPYLEKWDQGYYHD